MRSCIAFPTLNNYVFAIVLIAPADITLLPIVPCLAKDKLVPNENSIDLEFYGVNFLSIGDAPDLVSQRAVLFFHQLLILKTSYALFSLSLGACSDDFLHLLH